MGFLGGLWLLTVGLLCPGAGLIAQGRARAGFVCLGVVVLLLLSLRWSLPHWPWVLLTLAAIPLVHGAAWGSALWIGSREGSGRIVSRNGLLAGCAVVVFVGAASFYETVAGTVVGVKLYRVTGPSMAPTLQAGDWLVASSRIPSSSVQVGDWVLVTDPLHPGRTIIKRVEAIEPATKAAEAQWFIVGDNASHSLDSRHFGAISAASFQAKPLWFWRSEGERWSIRSLGAAGGA